MSFGILHDQGVTVNPEIMQTDHCPLSQFRIHSALLFTALLFISSSQSYAKLGHAQKNNWFKITKTPVTCIGSSVNEIEGKIYMIGGELLPPKTRMGVSSVRIYDVEANEWTTGTNMPSARPLVPKLSIGNKVYAIGGYRHDSTTWNRVEVYDISTDSWTRLADLPTPRIWSTGCVYNEKIYIMGGISPSALANELDPKGLDIVERYDPATDTWDTCAPMITGRFGSTTCVLNDSIYILGGIKGKEGNWPGLTTVEVYDPATDKWEQKAKMHIARTELTNVVFDGSIYAIGGFPDAYGHTVYSSFEVYNPNTNSWILHNDPVDMHPQGTPYQSINVGGRIWALNAVGPYVDSHPVFAGVFIYNEPIMKVQSSPLLIPEDTLLVSVFEACTIYIVPPDTPAKLDSIIGASILSFDALSIQEHMLALNELSPGTYRIYAEALDGRIDLNYFHFQVIDRFPECIILLQDAESKAQVDSCLLVVNEQDTIQGARGAYNLSSHVYETCSIKITHNGYQDFDTTLVVQFDTTMINLIPRGTGNIVESTHPEISIYPNPTYKLINVQYRTEEAFTLEIISTNGRILEKIKAQGSPVLLDLTPFKSGLYLVRIVSANHASISRILKL